MSKLVSVASVSRKTNFTFHIVSFAERQFYNGGGVSSVGGGNKCSSRGK